ncbi:MAG: hypothetical protein AAGH99_12865 [Planctomycetota bacterium]
MKLKLRCDHAAARLCRGIVFTLALVITSAAVGQDENTEISGEQIVADTLLRAAMLSLNDNRGEEGVERDDQAVRAQVLLDLALGLDPNDDQLWTMRARMAQQAGDGPGEIAALRRVVELKPELDAHRLRLVLSELAELETLDGRLAVLEEKIREAEQASLSKAYLSRLASAAASIAQEIGNKPDFLRHLKTAVRSDNANGEAAMLTYQLAVDREAKPLSVGAAAINVVRARPLDSDARLLLADALYRLGAYERAVEQFNVAAKLPRATPLPPSIWPAWTSSLIASGQKSEAKKFIGLVEKDIADRSEAEGVEVALPLELELRRRIIEGDNEIGQAALASVFEQLNGKAKAGDPEATLELAWIIAVFGEDTEAVTALLEGQDRNDPRYIRATGFIYLREGAERWARQAFEPIAENDSVAAYGLAVLQGRDQAGQARFLRSVVHDMPASFGGLLAAEKLISLGRDVMPGPNGQAILDAMNRLPITLWRVDLERNPWVSTRARFVSSRSDFLEPIEAQLFLQNGLDIPLPIDPIVGVGNQAFATVSAFSGGQPVGVLPPIVIDGGGRLSLKPRERLPIDVRLDRSVLGTLLATGDRGTLTYNTTFTSDPRILPNGAVVPGMLGSVDSVRSLQSFVPLLTAENLNQWSELADGSGTSRDRFVALNRLARLGDFLSDTEQIDRELSRKCIEVLTSAFERGDPVDQAWVLFMLNLDPQKSRSEFQPILDQGQRSESDLVRIVYLMRHVEDPEDIALTTAIRDGSPTVQRFASALRDFLSLPLRPASES